MSDFSTLKLRTDLLGNLDSLGYRSMTPIQAASLPIVLAGQDLIAQAKTGSGKTAAFGLGVLHKLDVSRFRIQALVLCPTRELADQVAQELRKLARAIHNIKILSLCGGTPIGPQIGSLEHGAHIIVGTPGRISDHLRKRTLSLADVETLVLDEADRMLDMGFQEVLDEIIAEMPAQRQTLLFSATYPDEIQTIAERVMHHPERVEVETHQSDQTIRQRFYPVRDDAQRLEGLRLLLMKHRPDSAIVFCNTKRETDEVADALRSMGFSALALHGDLEQKARDLMLIRFANKSATVLVATDVAARGLDIDNLDAVFNFHVARDLDVHVHRIGRTGRAGSHGLAFTFFSEKERYKLEKLSEKTGQTIDESNLPSGNQRHQTTYKPPMVTLQIDGGKKQKVRPGDILGALTGESGVPGKAVGKINVTDNSAFVAVTRDHAKQALEKLSSGKLKGRSFRARRI
ncbi:ATP-dependent RNA helicase DbpA [Marinobacter sp. R17]|uniref:ATP-dependent RNA helicase DbpA n=1 Tax=Marinobacter sp. R17 TaxID=2484250 RepID=UPI000F4BC981|nr:ATP-dependent RNA helicase DbpA [Marinobacter sp. R17]ROT99724.1 ATP-dependent RNA helicase DbpA [Marinobacter sp. R17]